MGLSIVEGQELSATMGSIFQGFGATEDAAAGFAEEIVRLGADLASFNNIETDDAINRIRGGLTGLTVPLKQLAIVFSQTDVEQLALIQTGKEHARELTKLEKATAALALITRLAGRAVGDVDATANSTANTIKRLQASFRDLKNQISVAVLPVFAQFFQLLDDNRDKIKRLGDATALAIGTFLAAARTDAGAAAFALGQLIGAKLGEGLFSALEKTLRFNISKLPIIGPLFSSLNVAAIAAGKMAGLAKDSAQDASDALTILAESGGKLAEFIEVFDNFQRVLATPVGGTGKAIIDPGLLPSRAAFDISKVDARSFAGGLDFPAFTNPFSDEQASRIKVSAEDLDRKLGMRLAMKAFGEDLKLQARQLGEDIVFGIINGTASLGDLLKRFFAQVATNFILGPLAKVLGIFSPSKVTAGMGVNLGRGLVLGMDRMQPAVAAAAVALASAATLNLPDQSLAVSSDISNTTEIIASIEPANPQIIVDMSGISLFEDPASESKKRGSQIFIREGNIAARDAGFR